jgi:hypothetical protein
VRGPGTAGAPPSREKELGSGRSKAAAVVWCCSASAGVLVFQRPAVAANAAIVVTRSNDGGAQRVIGRGSAPVVSPDGRNVAFLQPRAECPRALFADAGCHRLVVADIATGAVQQVAPYAEAPICVVGRFALPRESRLEPRQPQHSGHQPPQRATPRLRYRRGRRFRRRRVDHVLLRRFADPLLCQRRRDAQLHARADRGRLISHRRFAPVRLALRSEKLSSWTATASAATHEASPSRVSRCR